jgi:hypothetical protein
MAPRESKSQPQQSKTVLVSELKELLIRACCRYQWMMVDDFWQYLAAVTDSPLTRNHVGKVVSSLAGGSDETPGQYLFKFALPKTTSGAAPRVFVPGTASRELFRRQGEEDWFVWNKPDTMKRYSYSFMFHNLTATRLAIGAALHLRSHNDYYLAETLMSSDMLRRPPRLSPSAQDAPRTLIPDLWLHIIAGDGTEYPLWIEVDRGSESRSAFQRLFRTRLLYCKSEQYKEYFGTRHVRLCYAITSSKPPHEDGRVNAILLWADEVLEKEKLHALAPFIHVTTINYETLYDDMSRLFTESIWYQPNKNAVMLLSPITTQETLHEKDSDPAGQQTGHPSAQNASDHEDSGNACQNLPPCETPPGFPV